MKISKPTNSAQTPTLANNNATAPGLSTHTDAPTVQSDVADSVDTEHLPVLEQRNREFAQASAVAVPPPADSSPLAVRAQSMSVDNQNSLSKSDKSISAAAADLNSIFLYTSTPGEAGPSAVGDGKVSVGVSGRSVSADVGLLGNAVEQNVLTELDRCGVTYAVSARSPGQETSGGFYVMKDWGSAWVDRSKTNSDGTAQSTSVGPYFDPSGAGLSASLSLLDRAGVTRKIGGFAGGNASREVVDHGMYAGEEASLVGKRCIEVNSDVSAHGALLPGLLAAGFGIGGRLSFAKGKSTTYRTHVEPERARGLLFEPGNKLQQALRDGARATGLKTEPLPVPDLSKPQALQIGDRIKLRTEGSFHGGLVVGPGFGAYVGVQGAMRGDFDLSVERSSEGTLQVTVEPTRVKALQLTGRAIVLDASMARNAVRSMTQSFVFDMHDAAAMAAYQKLLQGELPGGGEIRAMDETVNGVPVAETILPSGVQRVACEILSGSTQRSHLDVGFLLLTLGATQQSGTYNHRVDLGTMRIDESLRVRELCQTIPLSGDETRGVRTSLIDVVDKSMPNSKPIFSGMRVVSYVNDTKVRGLELNSDIAYINRCFGTSIGRYNVESLKQSRSIELELQLDPTGLAALAEVDDGQWREAGQASDVKLSRLLALAQVLRQEPNPRHQAQAVQDYIAREGFAGAGVISRVVGTAQVQINTTIGAADTYLQQARELSFKYDQAIAADADNTSIAERFKSVSKLDDKLIRLRALVGDDPFIDDEKKQKLAEETDTLRAQLQASLSMRHLNASQRAQLSEQLSRGFISKWEGQALAAIRQAETSAVG